MLAILIGILGLALLMIVHEAGHMLAARASGMRVLTFSIGFGPTFFKIEPADGYFWFSTLGGKVRLRLGQHDAERHGPTVYQVAMIPFLAYVQVDGMNPFEKIDPDDDGSYANKSLLARFGYFAGGPVANYLFASVFFFCSFYFGGVVDTDAAPDTKVQIVDGHPAAEAGVETGDRVVEVAGEPVTTWDAMAERISAHPDEDVAVVVERDGERIPLSVTPAREGDRAIIGVYPVLTKREATAGEAAKLAVTTPPIVVSRLLAGLRDVIVGDSEAELGGPVMIVNESARAVKSGISDWLMLLGALSAYLGAFNLLPLPALDGGRLAFLGYELATRRKPNARTEARIHAVGLVLMLGLMLYITFANDLKLFG